MVFGLGRVMIIMGLGVVLHMEFFLGIVVKWLRFVKINNVLDGRVVLGGVGMEMAERRLGPVVFVVERQRVVRERKMIVDDVWITGRDENPAQLARQEAV